MFEDRPKKIGRPGCSVDEEHCNHVPGRPCVEGPQCSRQNGKGVCRVNIGQEAGEHMRLELELPPAGAGSPIGDAKRIWQPYRGSAAGGRQVLDRFGLLAGVRKSAYRVETGEDLLLARSRLLLPLARLSHFALSKL